MNPITDARELGRKAGLCPSCHLGLNPYSKGRQEFLWYEWRNGYEETCPQFTAQVKAKFDGLPHGGTEQFERK